MHSTAVPLMVVPKPYTVGLSPVHCHSAACLPRMNGVEPQSQPWRWSDALRVTLFGAGPMALMLWLDGMMMMMSHVVCPML
jgi:hypothetical protein